MLSTSSGVTQQETSPVSKHQYIQDSLALRIDGERIPSVVPTTPEPPKPRTPKRRLQDARSHGVPELKRCRTCNVVKPASEFTLNSQSRDGLWFRCAECNREHGKARYEREKHNRPWLERHLRRSYGITVEQYESMLAAQGGVCAICGGPQTGKNWHVDHDHETGEVRGILCHGCNHALGGARDNPDTLIAAAKYLWKRGK